MTDKRFLHTLTGFLYLTSLMYLYSRDIVGWNLSDSLSIAGDVKAIENSKRNNVLDTPVIHSYRGVQYV